MCGRTSAGEDEIVDAHLHGQFVECVALHEFRSSVGEESLTLTGKMTIDDVSYRSVEDGVAQELQSLVVDGFAFFVSVHDTLVHQRQFIIADVAGIYTDDMV